MFHISPFLLKVGDKIECKDKKDFIGTILDLTENGCSVEITPEGVKSWTINVLRVMRDDYKNN